MTSFAPALALLLALGLAVPASAQGQGQGQGPGQGPGQGNGPGNSQGEGRRGPPPRDTLRVEFLETVVEYQVGDLSGPPGFTETAGAARFLVVSDRPYRVVARFPTWQPGPPAPAEYRQPAFSDGTHRIGGRLYLQLSERSGRTRPGPPDWVGEPGRPDWVGTPGRPDWVDDLLERRGPAGRGRPADGARIYQTAEGRLSAEGTRRVGFWQLGADLGAGFTDNPSGLPAPGTYTLDVELTIQPR